MASKPEVRRAWWKNNSERLGIERRAKYAANPEPYRLRSKAWGKENLKLVRKARQIRRMQIVIELGGMCSICHYSKNVAALDFHHLDPTTKKKQVRDWQRPDFDVTTVQLLCRNCHAEIEHPDLETFTLKEEAA